MTLNSKTLLAFCQRSTWMLSALFLIALSTTAHSQQVSSSSDYLVNTDAASSSSSAMPAAPEAHAQDSGNQPGGSQYPHYGSGPNLSKWAFEAGGGFNAPVGNDTPYVTWGGNLTVGAGRNFTKSLGALVEYQFIDDKLTGDYIARVGTPGGNIHVWSFTIDPVLTLPTKGSLGAYITGGGGFYRAVTSFTTPVAECDIYYGYCIVGNQTLAQYSSNQGGLNFGGGVTYKIFGPDSNVKLFGEARYIWVDAPKATATSAGIGSIGLVPVTFGVRF